MSSTSPSSSSVGTGMWPCQDELRSVPKIKTDGCYLLELYHQRLRWLQCGSITTTTTHNTATIIHLP